MENSRRIEDVRDRIIAGKIIAVVREDDPRSVPPIVRALLDGGIRTIEITCTTPDAFALIGEIVSGEEYRSPDGSPPLIGAGSVRSVEDVIRVAEIGGSFAASPVCDPAVVRAGAERGLVMMPGALTPNEVVAAWNAGAHIVKVFPLPENGPAYIRALRAPLPDIPLAPSGGITSENARPLLEAGAVALNTGSWLTPDADSIEERCREIARRILLISAVSQTPSAGSPGGRLRSGWLRWGGLRRSRS